MVSKRKWAPGLPNFQARVKVNTVGAATEFTIDLAELGVVDQEKVKITKPEPLLSEDMEEPEEVHTERQEEVLAAEHRSWQKENDALGCAQEGREQKTTPSTGQRLFVLLAEGCDGESIRTAEGVEFTDGTVALSWLSHRNSGVAIFPNIKSVESFANETREAQVFWV